MNSEFLKKIYVFFIKKTIFFCYQIGDGDKSITKPLSGQADSQKYEDLLEDVCLIRL